MLGLHQVQFAQRLVRDPESFDDGGYSGGTLDRPALQRLLIQVRERQVNVVVFYKIDRLTRSLADFVKLMESLKPYPVSFVSVTQSFDTSEAMDRMVLNILLTFAQFEREMMGDRIRDKFQLMRQRGLYIHGLPPLGYDKINKQLVVNPVEAATVVGIFERVKDYTTIQELARALDSDGICSKRWNLRNGKQKGGGPITAYNLYKLLRNPVYLGLVKHGSETYPGSHPAILSRDLWEEVQNVRESRYRSRSDWSPDRAILRGLLFDEFGRPLQSATIGVGAAQYRSYASHVRIKRRFEDVPIVRVRSEKIEELVWSAIEALYGNPTEVRKALLSLGAYIENPRDLFSHCESARVALRSMTRAEQRSLLVDQVARIEVAEAEVRLWLRCDATRQFLETGETGGLFRPKNQTGERLFLVAINAYLQGPYSRFCLPLVPDSKQGVQDSRLVILLNKAFNWRAEVMQRRGETLGEIAASKRISINLLSRVMRLTYLAPDIQAAIYDGTHPATLSRDRLLYCGLPSDWAQQRKLLGFVNPHSGVDDLCGRPHVRS